MSFEKFAGVRLISWFLEHPTREIHFKELCRATGLMPPTVKAYCEEFIGMGWLREERKANLRIFSLDNEAYAVKAVKKAFFLELLHKNEIEALVDENAVSFALYGSHASGEFDEKSDVDLLVLGRRESVDFKRVKALEKSLGKPLQITVIPVEKWPRMKEKDAFASSVLRNHAVLQGASL